MRVLRCLSLCIGLCAGAVISARAQTDSATVAATILRLEQDWAQALIAQDSVRLQQLLAPEFALLLSAAPTQPLWRSAWFATLPSYRTRRLDISGATVRVFGDIAVASFHAAIEATVRGADRSGTLFITDIWHRRGPTWQVVARYSSLPEPPSAGTRAVQPRQ
ncbi:MAG TPA: nuclear transport factor 2 family protein [Gemmatimonadales bacterium]|nr:nuclear transport factor 2 family protein [Gemmatimonadales bacterium]